MSRNGRHLFTSESVTEGHPDKIADQISDSILDAILSQDMHIEGSLDRLVASVLPHEVTHTVFAYHFRQPVPRWADEGGAVLSEDDPERNRHDQICRQILNTPGRKIPLRRLFSLQDYPGDVMALYAEGFSVANFLVSNSNNA